jgi:hypothetical protein
MELAAAFFFTIPGPKMLWQFGERGYDLSINYPSGTNNDRLSNKPPRWEYMNDANRKKLYNVYSQLIKLRIAQPVFETTDFTYNLTGAVKTITLNDPGLKVVVVGNFDVQNQTSTITFPNTGKWYDYITKDSIVVNNVFYSYPLAAGEYHVLTSRNLNTTGPNTAIKDDVVAANGAYFYNYPNPVNAATTFTYNLKTTEKVTLKIYDLIGKEVANLLDARQVQGDYDVKWTVGNSKYVPNGMYFAKLQIGQNLQTIKVMVEK